MRQQSRYFRIAGLVVCMLNLVAIGFAQKTPQPSLVWSIGPLTKGEAVMDISFGSGDATFGGPHVDSQTRSIFSATRSIVFAGDRIVLASKVGERRISGTPAPAEVYKLLSMLRISRLMARHLATQPARDSS
jgi:hypothetical protein